MTLPLDLSVSYEALEKATGGDSIFQAIDRVLHEIYRTLGIVLYTRYVSLQSDKLIPVHQDVVSLIEDHFRRPSLEYWHELVKICQRHLNDSGDRLIKDFTAGLLQGLSADEENCGRAVLSVLASALGNRYEAATRLVSPGLLRLFVRLHSDYSAGRLPPSVQDRLLDSGLRELVLCVTRSVFRNVDIRVVVPLGVSKEGVIALVGRHSDFRKEDYPVNSDFIRETGSCYLSYYEDEDPFQFICRLVAFDQDNRMCSLYSSYDGQWATFSSMQPDGTSFETRVQFRILADPFELPSRLLALPLSIHEHKFGDITETNGVTHNLDEPPIGYIERPKVEEQLITAISQPKFFITTLEGFGGFGKTWLTRWTIWNLIDRNRSTLPAELCFSHIIWVSGKRLQFVAGQVEKIEPEFGSLEDLIDSILYMTGNHLAIGRPLEQKKRNVIEALNQRESTLLVLDNLETVPDKDEIWRFLPKLINSVRTDLRVVATTRTRFDTNQTVVSVPPMEDEEARQLALLEMKTQKLDPVFQEASVLLKILQCTGRIPLLIRYFILLLKDNNDFDDISSKLISINVKANSDKALEFMCGRQWSELTSDAQRLLIGLAYMGGRMTYAQAKLLCKFGEGELQKAIDGLETRSFLVADRLVDSILEILPPIVEFAKRRLDEKPDEKEFFESRKQFLLTRREKTISPVEEFDNEAALSRLFQQAELLAQKGDLRGAYSWYQEATTRFSESSFAWRSSGVFEFKYLDKDDAARASLQKAIDLDPKNPDNYSAWAFWEFNRGVSKSDQFYLKQSIDLNSQALQLTSIDEERKRLNDFIAKAHLRIAYMTRARLLKADIRHRGALAQEKNRPLKRAILLLEGNLYKNPQTFGEKYHNSIDLSLLAECFLLIGRPQGEERNAFDDCALSYLCQLCELESEFQDNSAQTKKLLRHSWILGILKRLGVVVKESDSSASIVARLLGISSKLVDMRQKAQPYLDRIR